MSGIKKMTNLGIVLIYILKYLLTCLALYAFCYIKLKLIITSILRKNASRMDPRHGHGMAADSSERGKDDWVDLGREAELHSSPSSSHDTNGNDGSGAYPLEHEESSCDVLDGSHSGHVEEEAASRSGKLQFIGH